MRLCTHYYGEGEISSHLQGASMSTSHLELCRNCMVSTSSGRLRSLHPRLNNVGLALDAFRDCTIAIILILNLHRLPYFSDLHQGRVGFKQGSLSLRMSG
jgi:hypothetical protein